MPQPLLSQVHVNAPLTNISVAFLQSLDYFVADKVFPIVPSLKQSDRYFKFAPKAWFQTQAKARGLSEESAGAGFDIDSTPHFSCTVKALHKDIDDQLRANADNPLNLDMAATEFVTRGLALRREKDFAAGYFRTGLWTGSVNNGDITPNTLWSATNSTPIKDIRTQMASIRVKTGYRPNRLVLTEDVWNILQDNADFLNRIQVTIRKIVTTDLLAAVLNGPEGDLQVLIAGAIEDTANEGASATNDYVFNKKCAMLAYAAPRPSLMAPTAGYSFTWTGFTGAGAQGNRIRRMRLDWLNSDRIEGEMAYDMHVVSTDLGAFFLNAIS